jgi:small subunit ribosomal protein S16
LAVKIRFKRTGRKKNPSYRLVITDSRCPRNGKEIEIVGTYHPTKEIGRFLCKEERIRYWLGVGAEPTERVAIILKKNNVITDSKIVNKKAAAKKFKKTKKESEVQESKPEIKAEENKTESKS